MLEPAGIITLTHSFAQEISVHVPWKKLLSESAIIKIKGLELTCIPQKEFNLNNTQNLGNIVFIKRIFFSFFDDWLYCQ